MTANWRRNAIKFVDRMNTNKTYTPAHTLFKEYDEIAREGVIHTYLKDDVTKGFFYGVKYIKEDKILHFFNLEAPDARITPWRLIKELINTGEVPEVKPYHPPAVERIIEATPVKCPDINLTRFEFDILINAIYLNPDNPVKEPWKEVTKKTSRVSSKSLMEHVTLGDLKPKSVPSVMASLTRKGLITVTGRENRRMVTLTRTGKLVLRREVTGA